MIWPLSVQWLAKSNQLYFDSFRKKGNNVLSNFKVRFLNWGLCKLPSWNGNWQLSTDLQINSHIFPIISFYEVPTLVVKISQVRGIILWRICIQIHERYWLPERTSILKISIARWFSKFSESNNYFEKSKVNLTINRRLTSNYWRNKQMNMAESQPS